MARAFTAEELIEIARDKVGAPDTASLGTTDADILERINDFYFDELIPRLLDAREAYFHVATRTALVASTSRYRIPARAVLQKVHTVRYVNADGLYGGYLDLFTEGDLDKIDASGDATEPQTFYLRGNHIHIFPELGTVDGSLEIVYPFRPGELVLSTAARQVLTVDSTTQVTLASAVPAGWTNAGRFDVHGEDSGAEIHAYDRAADTVSGTTIVFSSPIDGTAFGDTAVVAGDWVCLTGEAALPGVPLEFHPVLGQAGAAAVAELLGDTEKYTLHKRRVDEKLAGLISGLEQRVEAKRPTLLGTPFLGLHGGW